MAFPVIPARAFTTLGDSSAKEKLGTLHVVWDKDEGLKAYRYVFIAAASTPALANGSLVFQTDAYGRTGDIRVAQATSRNHVLGVAVSALAAGTYGYVQVSGYHSAVKTNGDDDIAKGDAIIASASDGVVDSVAAGTAPTYKPVGFATAADVDANNTVATDLCIVDIG